MKKISVVLIAALVVSLLFGCGKSDDAKGTGKTTLSVWYWGNKKCRDIRRIWKRW